MNAGVLAVTVPGFALGALGMALGSRRAPADVARARWIKFGVFAAIVHVVLLAAYAGRAAMVAVVVAVVIGGAAELGRAWARVPSPRPWRVPLVYLSAAVAAVATAVHAPPAALAWAYLVVAAADGFAQVSGQLFGRHSLAPQLSPGKTVEGALGGICAGVVVGAAARSLLGVEPWPAAWCAVAVACLGLVGDLSASWVKRRAGIKDYSAVLPGQGGVLDRFDSLLGALALGGWLLT